MKKYMFILGRDYELSILELVAYFEKNDLDYKIINFAKSAAIIEVNNLNPEEAINHLGSIVKIGKVLDDFNFIYQGSKNKIKYAISAYGNIDTDSINQKLKKSFKEQKLRAFYKKPKRGNALMPNEVIKQSLIKEGMEFLAFKNYFAITVSVFNPFEHEKRDEQMPCKDYMKTISIRLAKILINLSQAKESLLDPFCGHGIILQEAILQDINVIGIDIDKKSIESAKTNLRFIKKKYKTTATSKVIQGDCKKLSRIILKAEAIATEPYLGPYLKRMPTQKEAQKTMFELKELYSSLLKETKKTVKGKIAIIVPRFNTKNKEIIMDFNNIMKSNGYKLWQPIKEIQMPIIYPYGLITREIWVIEPYRKV